MASYTDKAPTFNPYVQQQPVEAMVKVGMFKQQQYDQNLQAIQSTMNKVVGMDIARGVDKEYLDNKMNEVTGKLQNFAAGDFSNSNLTRSMTGMISEVGGDERVQNAVFNTARYRKEYKSMQDAKKSGKSSIQNEAAFSEDASKWLNSTDPDAEFRAAYSPYYDVDAKWFEVFKGLHPSLVEEDIPYVQNEDGSINYGQTASAMKEVSKESVSAVQIENAIRARLTPEEINQLNINARYQFRGQDSPALLTEYSAAKYNTKIAETDKDIKALQALRDVAGSSGERQKYETIIKQYEGRKSEIEKQKQDEANYIASDLEGAKRSLYKNDAISQFAKAHAWERTKIDFVTNPILQQENWERKFTFDKDNEFWNRQLEAGKFNLDVRKTVAAERTANAAEQANTNEMLPFMWGTKNTVGTDKNYDAFVQFNNEADEATDAANAAFNAILPKGATKVEQQALRDKLDAYERGETDVDIADKTLADKYLQNKHIAQTYKDKMAEAEQKVATNPEARAKAMELNAAIQETGIDRISVPEGEGFVDVEVGDIFSFLNKMKSIHKESGSPYGVPDNGYRVITGDEALTKKEQLLFNHFTNMSFGDQYEETPLNNAFSQLMPLVDEYKEQVSEKDAKIREELVSVLQHYSPQSTNLDFAGKNGKVGQEYFKGVLTDLIANHTKNAFSMGGGSEMVDEAALSIINTELLKSDGSQALDYKMIDYGDEKFLRVQLGTTVLDMPIKADIANQLPQTPGIEDRYTRFINQSQDFNKGFSANPNASDPVSGAAIKIYEFRGLDKLKAVGNYQRDKDNQNKQYLKLKVILANGVTHDLDINKAYTVNDARVISSRITDAGLLQLIQEDASISEEFKEMAKTQVNASNQAIRETENNNR